MDDGMNVIMNRIKNRRLELNMSYQDFADRTGLSKSTLQRYETGSIKNMPIDKMAVVAKALMVTPAYLMGWEDSPEVAIMDRSAKLAVKIRNDKDAVELLEDFYSLDADKKVIAKNMIKVLSESGTR